MTHQQELLRDALRSFLLPEEMTDVTALHMLHVLTLYFDRLGVHPDDLVEDLAFHQVLNLHEISNVVRLDRRRDDDQGT